MFPADGLQQVPCLPALPPSRRVAYGLTGGFESRQKLSVDCLQALFDERRWIGDVRHSTIVLDGTVRPHPELPISRWVVRCCQADTRRPSAAGNPSRLRNAATTGLDTRECDADPVLEGTSGERWHGAFRDACLPTSAPSRSPIWAQPDIEDGDNDGASVLASRTPALDRSPAPSHASARRSRGVEAAVSLTAKGGVAEGV